jgi:ABC-2 type transport system permease protein
MGSAMFASGPQLARERQNGWMRQLRVSPISTRGWFAAKLVQAILLIIPGLVVLMALALTYGHVHMAAGRLGLLAGVLVLGAIPFCALGLVIGLMFDSQTAQVAQMITLLVLAFLGGIFIQWSSLPHGMQLIGKALPSYHLAQLGWNAAAGRGLGLTNIAVLAAWTAGLGLIAARRWRSESAARSGPGSTPIQPEHTTGPATADHRPSRAPRADVGPTTAHHRPPATEGMMSVCTAPTSPRTARPRRPDRRGHPLGRG